MVSIELDCAPFTPRPDAYIEGVLKDTEFAVDDFDTGAPFFGCQVWILKDKSREAEYVEKAQPVIKERVSALYHNGCIRYGSW